jgi:hypothetical protein
MVAQPAPSLPAAAAPDAADAAVRLARRLERLLGLRQAALAAAGDSAAPGAAAQRKTARRLEWEIERLFAELERLVPPTGLPRRGTA